MGLEGHLSGGGSADAVTSSDDLTDNTVIRGAGSKEVQDSSVTLTDDNEFQAGAGDIDSPTYSFSSGS